MEESRKFQQYSKQEKDCQALKNEERSKQNKQKTNSTPPTLNQ